jgi:hypothetical protein
MNANTNFFSIVTIGSSIDFHTSSIHTTLLEDCSDLSTIIDADIDFILLSTPVQWDADGVYHMDLLQQDIDRLREMAPKHHHKIILTSVIPIGESETLGCHYAPLSMFSVLREKRTIGYNPNVPTDLDLLRSFFSMLWGGNNITLRTTHDTEILYLIEICQVWINQSFQREIALFCRKTQITTPFCISSYPRKEMYPILVYMIRKIEDTKIDCPLLYSCLFRHNYIDIHI